MSYRKIVLPVAALVIVAAMSSCALFENKHVARGHQIFTYYCSHCHGEKGQGNGFNAVNLDPRPRDLSDRGEPYMAELTNQEIFHSIREGLAGSYPDKSEAASEAKEKKKAEEDEGGGSPLMPYWGYTLSEEQVWDLVAFVRTLHKNKADKIVFKEGGEEKKPALSRPQPVGFPELNSTEGQKLVEEGKHLYETKYSCAGCHRIGKKGGQVGPDLSRSGIRLNANWIYQWIQYP
jgi:mono/diheme cytochrome c family protein